MGVNQINYNLIDEEEKKQLELDFTHKHQILMCPFVIVDGVDSLTQGAYTTDPNRFKSASFDQVFQGRNPVIVIWKDSTQSINQKTPGGLPDFSKPAFKDFNVGETIPVLLNEAGETYFNSFDEDSRGNKRFSTSSDISIKFRGTFEREKWYDWYLFPELGEEFYYITTINILRDKAGLKTYTELSLKKVNDELEMVTTNADTLILRGTIGEEYAWPKVIPPENERQLWNDIILDPAKQIANGIKWLQLSSLEPMVLGSFYAWGRRIEEDEDGNKLITELRQLVPANLAQATPDPILGINAPSDKFYWLEQGRVSVGKEYKNWFGAMKENIISFFGSDENNKVKNYGAIKIEDMETAVQSAPNITKKDEAGNIITVPQAYWDNWTIKAVATIEYDGKEGYKTFTPYATERLQNRTYFAYDKLTRNIFVLSDIVTLPIEYESKISYGIVSAVVGGLKKIILGKDPLYLDSATNRENTLDIPLMGEHSYIDFISGGLMESETGTDSKKYLPLQLFSGDRPEVVTGKNINTFNIKIELSDEIYLNAGDVVPIETQHLGKNKTNYYNDDSTTKRSNVSYILDRIVVQGISLGDIKITAFNEHNQAVGAFTLNTNAKKTGSILDWTTVIKTSSWESDETQDVTPDVPAPGNVGPKETELFGFNVNKINNVPYNINGFLDQSGDYDLYEEFKLKNPDYEGTREEFLLTHSIKMEVFSIRSEKTSATIFGTHYSYTHVHDIGRQTISSFGSPIVNKTWELDPFIYEDITSSRGSDDSYMWLLTKPIITLENGIVSMSNNFTWENKFNTFGWRATDADYDNVDLNTAGASFEGYLNGDPRLWYQGLSNAKGAPEFPLRKKGRSYFYDPMAGEYVQRQFGIRNIKITRLD